MLGPSCTEQSIFGTSFSCLLQCSFNITSLCNESTCTGHVESKATFRRLGKFLSLQYMYMHICIVRKIDISIHNTLYNIAFEKFKKVDVDKFTWWGPFGRQFGTLATVSGAMLCPVMGHQSNDMTKLHLHPLKIASVSFEQVI